MQWEREGIEELFVTHDDCLLLIITLQTKVHAPDSQNRTQATILQKHRILPDLRNGQKPLNTRCLPLLPIAGGIFAFGVFRSSHGIMNEKQESVRRSS